jgi:alkylresorcinol/alkylpyrone synthase
MNSPIVRPRSSAPRAEVRARPRIAGSALVLPAHRYSQQDIAAAARAAIPDGALRAGVLERFFDRVGVSERHLALSVEDYVSLRGFRERNDAWISVAVELGERAVRAALDEAGLEPADIAMMTTTTVTGIAVPSLDARLMNRLDLPSSMVRMPLFGLGCLGGAAGLARVADWLRAYPDRAAILLSVELCSLTFQPGDASVANLISTGLFGDGAAAVVVVGGEHPLALAGDGGASRPRVIASRSAFFPGTERVMGWDMVDTGFKVVLSADVPKVVRQNVPAAVDGFLGEHGLTRADIGAWVMHPGGPKVIEAIEDSLELGRGALVATRESLERIGNLSSASVLAILDEHRKDRAPVEGTWGILMAMGPAFCAELVLLRF